MIASTRGSKRYFRHTSRFPGGSPRQRSSNLRDTWSSAQRRDVPSRSLMPCPTSASPTGASLSKQTRTQRRHKTTKKHMCEFPKLEPRHGKNCKNKKNQPQPVLELLHNCTIAHSVPLSVTPPPKGFGSGQFTSCWNSTKERKPIPVRSFMTSYF